MIIMIIGVTIIQMIIRILMIMIFLTMIIMMIIIIMCYCRVLMSVILDTPGAPHVLHWL